MVIPQVDDRPIWDVWLSAYWMPALVAADELEVFDALEAAPLTAEALGEARALNPFALKWNFMPHRNVMPYIDIGGGTLFTNNQVPSGTSRVNFTTSGALGLHFLRSKYNWNAEVRFMHISNAGLSTPNPGINTIQFRIGFGRFTQPM